MYLNTVLLLQHSCCFCFDVALERTAHILMHQLDISMDQFKTELKEFTELNIHWIQDVGQAVLDKLDLRACTYVNGINQGTLPFDELALFIACRCFNIHAIVMLDNDVWSTKTNVLHSKATVRLAYCGKNSYREIAAINDEVVMELPGCIADSVDIDLTDSDSGYEEQTGDENI